MEDNPYTFLEVQTLLDGVTVGGHSLFDQTQVLNQKQGLDKLIDSVKKDLPWDKSLAKCLHYCIAKEEALKWGEFRDSAVGIGGTSHKPPEADQLDKIFDQGLAAIYELKHPFERALVYFFWGSMNQFFFDGNKRTSRAMMDYQLLKNGYYYLTVPARLKEEFSSTMINFYDTKDATAGMQFLLNCYINYD